MQSFGRFYCQKLPTSIFLFRQELVQSYIWTVTDNKEGRTKQAHQLQSQFRIFRPCQVSNMKLKCSKIEINIIPIVK